MDVAGDYALAASLGTTDGMADGSLGIVDQKSGRVVSTLEINKLLGHDGHAPGMLTQGAQGGRPAPSASRMHRIPTHFPLNFHGI